VLDGACVVFDGKQGVEPQSGKVWFQAEKYRVPRMCYINKLDNIGADFYKSYESIVDHLSEKAVPIQIPIGFENEFTGVVDLVTMKGKIHEDEEGKVITEIEIPENLVQKAKEYREKLLEAVADFDDVVAEKFLNGEEIGAEELQGAVRKAVIANELFPVLAGSSLKNKGIQALLDSVCKYLPSPFDKSFAFENPETKAEDIYHGEVPGTDPKTEEVITRKLSATEPFCGLVFKLANDPHVGNLSFFRVYSGTLAAGSYVYNPSTRTKERVGRIVMMHANAREEVPEVKAGDIAAIVGLKDTQTGNTLCDESKQILLESIDFPEPVVSFAIEPKTKSDQDKLGEFLGKLASEDPTFKVKTDEETGQTIISGMGELHLDIKITTLRDDFKIDVTVGAPQVAYRETIKAKAEHRELLKKQTGGAGQYADISMVVEPQERGVGYEFVDSIRGGSIPREYIPSIDKGFQEALKSGPLGGYPVVDVKATITDGSYHDVDSNTDTFKTAATHGFKNAMKLASPILLEPIMKVAVNVPDDHVGSVTGYLSSRRGIPKGMVQRGRSKEIQAEAPLAEMFGLVTNLRNLTSGTASASMEFSHYAEVPAGITKQILGDTDK
jgi:elongation factor G